LYQALIADLRDRGVHCAVGGIALPNPASIALHEKVGFSKVGQLREVGWKLGRWVDVGYWELLL
jgi:phosphinothricin acetyltransferase